MVDPSNSREGSPLTVGALVVVAVVVVVGLILSHSWHAVGPSQKAASTVSTGLGRDANAVAQKRNLSPDDVVAALKTYMPSGRPDDYLMFASTGHAGQVLVIGVPSMRILKEIAVFTPEPWQGWGYGSQESKTVLDEGKVNGKAVLWGDTHHPALSQTNAVYDGQFLFINDKANSRIACIDLRDLQTKQIVKNPLVTIDHGGSAVTPNTDWVIEGGQYAQPLGVGTYAPMSDYKTRYRGLVTFWKFDRQRGRIDPDRSFAMELPPYWQDLAVSGRLQSDGWVFLNSFNTEMATGGVESGKPPFEAGASQKDMDYLHIINLKKAAQIVASGQGVDKEHGMTVVPLKTSIEQGLLYFTPEPKSPHGVDVTPGGEYLVISGKLDPHVTVYSFQKIQDAIAKGNFEKDAYGVPILKFEDVMEKQVEVGLGPLHTQFDDHGYAYTSLFLDSAVARWTLGGPYEKMHAEPPWTEVTKIPVQYNVGHISIPGGDTAKPDGQYLVSMNKWSVDRFKGVGPLLPQNFQLIDIANPGAQMQLLYDMPVGNAEPHYAEMIKADKIKAWDVYPQVGWDPLTQAPDPNGVQAGKERIVRHGNTVEIWMTAVRSHYNPEHVEVHEGDHVIWHITNIERAKDATHGFALSGYNINLSLEPGKNCNLDFVADRPGVYPYYCTEFCSALHLEMTGYFLVKPRAVAGR